MKKIIKGILNLNIVKKWLLFKSIHVNSYVPIRKGVLSKKRKEELIVSLTSYPLRISTVHLTIYSLMHQTCKPDRIILWLAQSEFPKQELDLPKSLIYLKRFGLEIKWCEDIKSFKKLIPTLKMFPDAAIITADDDQYYPITWVQGLYDEYKKNRDVISDYDVTRLKIGKLGLLDHDEKYVVKNREKSYFNKVLGGYGCIYPPNSLSQEVFNSDIFMKYVGLNDDVWFWGMAVKNGTLIMRVVNEQYTYCMTDVENQNKNALWNKNCVGKLWIDQLNNMIQIYPEIYEKLTS